MMVSVTEVGSVMVFWLPCESFVVMEESFEKSRFHAV